jgi:hypothetical protein
MQVHRPLDLLEGMENLVTTGKIPEKRDRGRQREKILDGVCRWLGVRDNKDIFRDVRDRKRWKNMIDNVSGRAHDDDVGPGQILGQRRHWNKGQLVDGDKQRMDNPIRGDDH